MKLLTEKLKLFSNTRAKTESNYSFTEQINPSYPVSKIWFNINKLSGATPNMSIHHIEENNAVISNAKDIANIFAKTWSIPLITTHTITTYLFCPLTLKKRLIEFVYIR